ncbi:aminoacyl tRNA synthase complex-interacting multifunctional protein 1-like [Mytilus edulis]|uniref:aminoacyl tRNA synthase complex-interacting multifunctional protein 1-like n=1 Tax=Mytilus edulis TaxID=6550 RepID=UPI0039F016DF
MFIARVFQPIRMASASVLQRLNQRTKEAENIISELKGQIENLRQSAAISISKPEEDRLRIENEDLKKDIETLKVQLILAEASNGVRQIPLPTKKGREMSGSANDSGKDPEEPKVKVEPKEKPSKGEKKKDQTKTSEAEPKAKKGKPEKKAAAPTNENVDVSRLDFRVGKIVKVEKHPDADTLYLEQVDVGEGKTRTVVSGLVKHITLEEMQDKVAVFMCNLKPAKMRGVLSEAMIMCASTPEKVEILNVPKGAAIGDKVFAEGYTGEPDAMLNPKKKVWEAVKPDLRVSKNKVATYKGAALKIEGKGEITSPSLADVAIQ